MTHPTRRTDPVQNPPVVHLEECSPEQHQGWEQVPYREALALGARMCQQTQYMAEELFADEMVWIERNPAAQEPDEETEVARLRRELAEADALRERMTTLLTEVANALKGAPDPLTMHDWSDLPEVAAAAVQHGRPVDRMAGYRAARAWAADHRHQSPDDRMLDAALDAALGIR